MSAAAPGAALRPETWRQALDAFARYLADGPRASSTIDGYMHDLERIADAAAAGPWDLRGPELGRWLDEQPWSQRTRRKVLSSLRVFYGWATSTVDEQGRPLCAFAPTAGLPSATPRRRGPAARPLPESWVEDVEQFAAWIRAGGRSEGTVRLRIEHLRRLAEVAADPWSMTTVQLAVWLSNPDWSSETKRSIRGSLRAFYRWGVVAGRIAESPAEQLDPVLRIRGLPRPAPDDAIREALAAADDRLRLAIMLGAFAGLRRSEIVNLHTRDIAAEFIFVVGKGGHHRRVPMHPELRGAIEAELTRRRAGRHGSGWGDQFVTEHGYLFPSDRHPGPMTAGHLARLISESLPGEWTTHTLRHRFATSAYVVQRDLRAVQELLGHVHPDTTARYAAVPDGATRAAVDGVGLRW